MFGMSVTEILMILVIALIVIGPKRLPEVGKWLGNTLRTWKNFKDDIETQFKENSEEFEKPHKELPFQGKLSPLKEGNHPSPSTPNENVSEPSNENEKTS